MAHLLAALQPGASYLIETLEGPRYGALFDRLIRPEALDAAALVGVAVLVVPCRTHPQRLKRHWPLLARFLGAGGALIVMGETFPDQWIPGVVFHPVETNYWWWLEKDADLGLTMPAPHHPLVSGMTAADATWHLHGSFEPPAAAEVLVADRDGQAVLYADAVSFGGLLAVTSLDPMYHHGSHFMPAATRFLDRFLPNLRKLADGAFCP